MRRKYFIKDLFNSKEILNAFKLVEFESLKCFMDAYEKNLFILKTQTQFTIPIKSVEEFESFSEIIKRSNLSEHLKLNLFIEFELLTTIFKEKIGEVKDKKFNIITVNPSKKLEDFATNPDFLVWTQNNPIWIEVEINYYNFRTVVEKILYIYNNQRFRFFWLKFDYESFEQMTFEELHELIFWMNQLATWVLGSRDKKYKYPHIQLNSYSFFKEVFLSKDLKLYLNRKAFEDNYLLFDLQKYIDCNGEEVPFKDLNLLRSYTDLVSKAMVPRGNKMLFMNFYDNYKIMGHINEIPFITTIIGDNIAI